MGNKKNVQNHLIPYHHPIQISSEIYSEFAVLVKYDTLEVIAEKNYHQRMYPASMTKVMTTILLIELIPDLNQRYLITNDIINETIQGNASVAGFNPGEYVTASDLLNAILLPSGADGVLALIYGLGYNLNDFTILMNNKAFELNMNQTHYMNPIGLHHPDHYSSTYDMTKLLRYALANDTFKTLYTTATYQTEANDYAPYGHLLESSTFSKLTSTTFDWGEILGGKTGFTGYSGLNLSTLAKDNNNQLYLLITANAGGSLYSTQYNFLDAYTIYQQFLTK